MATRPVPELLGAVWFYAQQSGLMSALPFVAMWATQLGTGLGTDMLLFHKKQISTTVVRKICVIVGTSPTAAAVRLNESAVSDP